jgi:hypothetical protein
MSTFSLIWTTPIFCSSLILENRNVRQLKSGKKGVPKATAKLINHHFTNYVCMGFSKRRSVLESASHYDLGMRLLTSFSV